MTINPVLVNRTTNPVIVVGCFADKESERVVSKDQLEALSKEWNCPSLEISALDETQVKSIFQILIPLCKAQRSV